MDEERVEQEVLTEEDQSTKRPDYQANIREIIRGNATPKMMREQLSDYHENDVAEVLPQLTVTERKKLYIVLGMTALSDIFEYLDEDQLKVVDEFMGLFTFSSGIEF